MNYNTLTISHLNTAITTIFVMQVCWISSWTQSYAETLWIVEGSYIQKLQTNNYLCRYCVIKHEKLHY